MRSDYELLGLAPTASADEIKRAFRHAIGKYHPDKFQHLGQEFQEIAAARTAEITRAYRTLRDASARPRDDRVVSVTVQPLPGRRGVSTAQVEVDALVRHAALGRLREAIRRELGPYEESPRAGFDLAVISGNGDLWRRRERTCVLVRLVAHLDAHSVRQAWTVAWHHEPDRAQCVCVLVLGATASSPEELRPVVDDLRRRSVSPSSALTVVPVDIRTWSACAPPNVPALVSNLLQRLRAA